MEKGVRNQKCEAPEGPWRLLVPDPFFAANPKLSFDKTYPFCVPGFSTEQ